MKLQIKGVSPIKVGNSYYFNIPKQYINNGVVDLRLLYNILISERK